MVNHTHSTEAFSNLASIHNAETNQLLSGKGLILMKLAAALFESGGCILIACRSEGKTYGGSWELPGGKIEKNETPEECLKRELQEEFGISVEVGGYVAQSANEDGTVEVLTYRVRHLAGSFQLRDHSEIRWVNPPELANYRFTPADVGIIKHLMLLYGSANQAT